MTTEPGDTPSLGAVHRSDDLFDPRYIERHVRGRLNWHAVCGVTQLAFMSDRSPPTVLDNRIVMLGVQLYVHPPHDEKSVSGFLLHL